MTRYRIMDRRADTYDLWLVPVLEDGTIDRDNRELISIEGLSHILGFEAAAWLGHDKIPEIRYHVACTCDPRPIRHEIEFEVPAIKKLAELWTEAGETPDRKWIEIP